MKLKNILKTIWEFPQNLLGWIIFKVTRARLDTTVGTSNVYIWDLNGGMSLGKYIFVPLENMPKSFIMHEYGHSIQSKYLGWLYLLVIGLPSLIWAQCFGWLRRKYNISYSWFYTEKWADKLGGVDR